MEFPFSPPYCLKSILFVIKSISHITTKCSVTLLKKEVKDIGLRSSSVSGNGTLLVGTMCSNFHGLGHSPELAMLFMILVTGWANSGANS